ncbi:class I SAM-dependent methyltransferase [Salinimicrobium flavum]|uniref:Methyltransferase domain-containing protein n=1 Tax=Salinimicrobium flavum TaxID=1737065 RepID=A0ABW5IWW2_9FLAO
MADANQEKNKQHYEKVYENYSLKNILWWLNHLEEYFNFVTTHETSWYGLYQYNFREKIIDKKVLEMGCGDCNNAAVMAALGARVYANDLASSSGKIVDELNNKYKFKYPIQFVPGDFLDNKLKSDSFDFIVGKAFLHHLTVPVERKFLAETSRLLKESGEARFFEPAVNNMILDEIRWYMPVGDRPSKFNKQAFEQWKFNDPHPDRSFSSRHFKKAGEEFFQEVEITPIGSLERFRRLFKVGKLSGRYTKWALKNEKHLPEVLNISMARSQLIVLRRPA